VCLSVCLSVRLSVKELVSLALSNISSKTTVPLFVARYRNSALYLVIISAVILFYLQTQYIYIYICCVLIIVMMEFMEFVYMFY